jgi:hypothetical protein
MAVYKRWSTDSFYRETVFCGTALDIGAAGDPLARYRAELPNLTQITGLDLEPMPSPLPSCDWIQAPATEIPAGSRWDVVYSSHCLEHLTPDAIPIAAVRWWNAVKLGGYLVIIVPDMEMYERGHWPSKFNGDHKTRWVLSRGGDEPDDVMGLWKFVHNLPNGKILRLHRLEAGFIGDGYDQTASGVCESGIEAVVRKTT